MKTNIRMILYVLACGLALILWQRWQLAQQPPQTANPAVAVQEAAGQGVPSAAASSNAGGVPVATTGSAASDQASRQLIDVHTDVLHLQIDPQGGTVVRAELLDYSVSKDDRAPLALMRNENPMRFLLQSGLVGGDAPTHAALFASAQNEYRLADGAETLSVPLTWQGDNGVTVEKTYTFKRGEYDFRLEQSVNNQSSADWRGFAYHQLVFGQSAAKGGIGQLYTFTGAVTSTPDDRYHKIDLADIRKSHEKNNSLNLHTQEGWVAMIQHYFLGALIPQQGEAQKFYTNYHAGDHIVGTSSAEITVAAGSEARFAMDAYVGPKQQDRLKAAAPYLDKTVDYGFLFMIAQPMFKALVFIHSLIGNWGWAIIAMTILIKLIFFVPSAWAYKSMAKMRKLAPEMQRLKERYGDDRQAMSQAMMRMYREEKVNPASGCLPMLLQIPFFIAFYWVLVESVELRQAPWFGWIQDLSVMDPYFILPVINAGLMFLQQKLNPPPPDPVQAKVMMMLPLIFGFMFMWFPSGLVLYWTVSNAFGIVQQYVMNKRYGEPRIKPAKAAG
ncbi:MAG: membrane protein insertase YidC [Cardiobacteriaceae bacterium]|nr:membrane protein insertase YidC [Cardiobacteriaceae bacterium]